MKQPHPNQINRRDLLRNGTLAISLGAIVAACGGNGDGAPGRVGVVAPPDELDIDASVDDEVLLRTLQSLEYTLIELYSRLLDVDAFGDDAELIQRFVDDHTANADQIGELITANGGQEYACANTFLMERAVEPVLTAVADSDDAHRDALDSAYVFEAILGASYQSLVIRLDAASRPAMMLTGGQAQRHAALVALEVNPDEIFGPETLGEIAGDSEFTPVYAVPAMFGQLGGIELVVGAPDDEGGRTSVQLQTPAENSFVYHGLAC